MRHPQLANLESLSILPTYPFTSTPYEDLLPPFEFGLQLVSTVDNHQLNHFELGLPIEMCTNPTQRQHLAELKPVSLGVTMLRPTVSLFEELAGLVQATTDTIHLRYLHMSTREMMDPTVFFSPPLEGFKNIVLHLPRCASASHRHPYSNRTDVTSSFAQRIVDTIMPDEANQERYTVWIEEEMVGFDVNGRQTEELLWQAANRAQEEATAEIAETMSKLITTGNDDPAQGEEGPSNQDKKGKKSDNSWERETNLSLFGGLLSLRMESKKH